MCSFGSFLGQRFEEIDILKISSLFGTFGNNVATDVSVSDADKLYDIIKGISGDKVSSIGLADAPNNYVTTADLNGQSIDVPSAGMFNYSAIQTFIRGQLKDPYIVKENAPIMILNGTDDSSLGQTEAATLESYGYNVVGTANAPTSNYSQTMVINLAGNKDKYTNNYLDQRFSTSSLNSLPDNSIQTNGASFVIILGNDETVNSQGQTNCWFCSCTAYSTTVIIASRYLRDDKTRVCSAGIQSGVIK